MISDARNQDVLINLRKSNVITESDSSENKNDWSFHHG